jgi:hypothetical protein
MKIVGGHFNGTAEDTYVGIGFVPDWVTLFNITGTQGLIIRWNKNMMVDVDTMAGIQESAADGEYVGLAVDTGIKPYRGGDKVPAGSSVAYGHGNYLTFDHNDYRYVNGVGGKLGDAIANAIDTWTFDSAKAGHFNADVTGTYIGIGSRICIDGKWYTIQALTAAQGISASEVTLSEAVPSGKVEAIYGKFGLKSLQVGEACPAGFFLDATTNVINVHDQVIVFEAGSYSN